ncbi:MAG: sialate O-acetylesterase [Verrucomicrobiota bacterium]
MRKNNFLLAAAIFLTSILTSSADVRLPALFSDHMVLQRGKTVPVWGWADDGETVTVTFRNQKVSTQAKDGKWRVNLSSLKAGGPDVLKVTGKNSIALTNVLVGEVWLCSGQSNMEFALKRAHESQADIAASSNSALRLFQIPNVKSDKPLNDVKANWTESTPETSANFSAVAYYFGRDLQKHLGVPIGLIQSDWGGSPADAWVKENILHTNPLYQEILDRRKTGEDEYKNALAKFEKEKAANPTNQIAAPRAPWKPGELYNGMIAPLIPYAMQGVIWYQGESNAPRAHQYRSLFPDLIRNWRSDWAQGDFPFLLVQLAPFDRADTKPESWAELREAQLNATKILPKVGMAVITDVGEETDIHPKKKKPVGERLAVAARQIAYGEKLIYSGPIYKTMQIKGDKIILSFDHIGSGLETRSGALQGFTICGADRKFFPATAQINGNEIMVSNANVKKPIAVRYGWANFPVVNLWNKEGFPASPFRTDDFQMVTAQKE